MMMKRNSFNLTIGLCVLLSLSLSCSKKTQKSEMLLIPAGYFWMGSDESEAKEAWELCKTSWKDCPWDLFKAEMPKHKVYLDVYSIEKYEVTNAQYKECVNAGKCEKPSDTRWYDNETFATHPVVNVDWTQANDYCMWAGKRLPTEAEWEKAARGEQGYVYHWGNKWDENKCNNWNYKGSLTSQMANVYQNRGTVPVGSFTECVSPYGVVDMAGNVWEWVSDWADVNYYKNAPEKNPKGPNNGKYKGLRGGSWRSYDPIDLRGANRYSDYPDFWGEYGYGFRCAKSAE